MSAASTPAPRSKSSSDSRTSAPRHTLFVPMFILLLGSGALASYQVMSMEQQLDDMTQAVDKYDIKVKVAQYEKAKFYHMAKGVLLLAPKDTNAAEVATLFKLKELQVAQPELMNADSTSDLPTLSGTSTNAAPIAPSPSTNAAPVHAASPTAPPK